MSAGQQKKISSFFSKRTLADKSDNSRKVDNIAAADQVMNNYHDAGVSEGAEGCASATKIDKRVCSVAAPV